MNGRYTLIQLFAVGVVLAFFSGQAIAASSAVPGKATLRSPAGKVSESLINYTWEAVPGANWYCLWINDSKGNAFKKWYTAEESGCGLGSGQCSVAGPKNLAAGTCQWWVQTWNEALYGKWSAGKSFTIGGAGTDPIDSDTVNDSEFLPTAGSQQHGVVKGTTRQTEFSDALHGIPASSWQYRWTSGASIADRAAPGTVSLPVVANSRQ